MADRDEGTALRGLLRFPAGGREVELPVLTLEETDGWLLAAGHLVSGMAVDDDDDPGIMLSNAMRAGSRAAVAALVAYDRDDILGGEDRIRRTMAPTELRGALEVVLDAALPFDVDAARSVAAAFGGPTRLTMTILAMAMTRLTGQQPPVPSTPSPLPTGASGTNASGGTGPRSSSSSGGRTATSSGSKRPTSIARSSRTA